MSYKLSMKSRARPPPTRAPARMSRTSGARDEMMDLGSNEVNIGTKLTPKTPNKSTPVVIDLTTPSPPGSRTHSRAPPPLTAATESGDPGPSQDKEPSASRLSRNSTMGALASKPVADTPGLSKASPSMGEEDSQSRSSRASRRREEINVPAQEKIPGLQTYHVGSPRDDSMDIDRTSPPPQIKTSPRSAKRKYAVVDVSQLSESEVPTVVISSNQGVKAGHGSSQASKQPTPKTNVRSRSNLQNSPKVKISPHSVANQQWKESTHSESESEAENAVTNTASRPTLPGSEPESDGESPSPSSEMNRQPTPTCSRPGVSTRSAAQSQASTISFSSSLIPRLEARKQREQVRNTATVIEALSQDEVDSNEEESEQQQTSVALFSSTLHAINQDMMADHAVSTQIALKKARLDSANVPQLSVDKTNVWANMKSVSMDNSSSTKASASTPNNKFASVKGKGRSTGVQQVAEPMSSWIMSKGSKWNTSKSSQLGRVASGDTPRVPRYSSHTTVSRNILSADSEKLKYVPYLGHEAEKSENHDTNLKRLLKDLQEAYSHGRIGSARQADLAFRISRYLNVWFANQKIAISEEVLIHYILTQETAVRLGLRECEKDMLLESYGEPLSEQDEASADAFWQAFDQIFQISLPNVVLPLERLKEMMEHVKKTGTSPGKSVPASGEGLGTYTSLTCLICGGVDCPTHADYSQYEIPRSEASDDEERESDWYTQRQPLVLPYNDMIRRHNVRKRAKLEHESEPDHPRRSRKNDPCSDDCWRLTPDHADRTADWGSNNKSLLGEMFLGLPHEERACEIAFALGLPCWEVYLELEEFVQKHGIPPPTEDSPGRAKRAEWYDNKRKTLHSNFQEMTQAHLHQDRSQALPCTHKGHCSTKCPCFEANILCEDFCGCADDCPRRFTGCSCLSTGLNCVSESCICVQMNRECGPQCVSCGAIARIDPSQKYNDSLFTWGCQNVPLQRGVAKKTVVGESQLVGFGLYVAEDVRKGDCINEYKGEVISGQEAERRGIIYDRKYLSFLFDLNRDYVIDAARYGNSTRFINHADSEKDGLNCEAKVVFVNGEHRIKFVALRDIKNGEELLFNYGKKFADKHGLSKKLPKTTEVGKNGILPQGALRDALDGVDARQNSARGKVAAVRGRPRGSRGKHTKMRKIASSGQSTAIAEDLIAASTSQETQDDLYASSQDVEEENDEDEDDEQTVVNEGRARRKITRPARYTR